jgi:hypothetical protein
MELAEPNIAQAFARCLEAGAERVVVSLLFLSPGRHATSDIPRIVQQAAGNTPFIITDPLGVDDLLVQLMLKRVDEAKVFAAIDAANTEDPEGKAVIYGHRMSAKLVQFAPDASLALQIAVRSQHIRRWEIPRDSFPATRQGYHQWRRRLYDFHAETASTLLADLGHDSALCDRVAALLRKQDLGSDSEAQTLEDIACLVFIEHYFAEFASKHDRQKLVRILQKTWGKMSEPAHLAALRLDLLPELAGLVQEALA